jgi:DNA-directed RNA polymerase subunit L
MDSSAVFFLRTHKGKPKTALTKAVSKIEKELDSFKKAVENAL